MFDNPDGTPPVVNGESVFACVDIDETFKLLLIAGGGPGSPSITEAAESIVTAQMHKLAASARAGAIDVRLRVCSIEEAIGEVVEFKPWTMSWSNVMDYMPDEKRFHELARACSINGDTIHYG